MEAFHEGAPLLLLAPPPRFMIDCRYCNKLYMSWMLDVEFLWIDGCVCCSTYGTVELVSSRFVLDVREYSHIAALGNY